jgi:NADH-quinone oxidoreductase subunit M
MPKLLWLFLTPFITSLIAFLLPSLFSRKLKKISFLMSLIPLSMLLSGGTSWFGMQIDYPWISTLSIHFYLSVDSLSLVFLYLVNVIIPISFFAVRGQNIAHSNYLCGLILLLQGLLIGFFTANDLAVFTFFWEAMLLPLYFLINMWGGQEREKAAYKFIIYMLAGSVLMIAAVLSLYFSALSMNNSGTFNLDTLAGIADTVPHAAWVAAVFLLAFAVKTPLFPFHAWLPDAYCQASTTATILLSAVLSKAGVYGIVRIGIGLFPQHTMQWSPILLSLAIIGVLYGGLAAWGQKDFKRLIAYSSFSHVNFVLAGLFVWNQIALSGAILQALNHAVTITGLFLVSWWLEMRLGTTSMDNVSGLAKYLPRLCWITLFFVLSSVALPGLNNFVGELMILYGLFVENAWLAAILGLTVILSVIYMLRWMQDVYFQIPISFKPSWVDIKGKDIVLAFPLIALILWLGLYPTPVLRQIQPASEKIAAHSNLEKAS